MGRGNMGPGLCLTPAREERGENWGHGEPGTLVLSIWSVHIGGCYVVTRRHSRAPALSCANVDIFSSSLTPLGRRSRRSHPQLSLSRAGATTTSPPPATSSRQTRVKDKKLEGRRRETSSILYWSSQRTFAEVLQSRTFIRAALRIYGKQIAHYLWSLHWCPNFMST